MVFVCLICERSLCVYCRMKYLYDLLILYYGIVVYRENIGKINIEEMCMVYYKYSCVYFCKICKFFICIICLMVYEF